jgi:hypothetical protein
MIMYCELEKTGEEGVMAYFEELSWHSRGGTEEKY